MMSILYMRHIVYGNQKMILKTGKNQKHSEPHTIVGGSTKRYI